jgi:hypothetical protein
MLYKLSCLLLSFSIAYGVLRWDVLSDFAKTSIKHRKEFILRVALLLPSIVGLTIIHPWPWYWAIIPAALILSFNYWNLFDGWLNKKKKLSWFYNGDVTYTGNTSNIDKKLLRRITDRQEFIIKIGGSIVTALFYFLTLFN